MFCHVLPDGLGPTEGHTFVIYPILNSPVEFVWKTSSFLPFMGFNSGNHCISFRLVTLSQVYDTLECQCTVFNTLFSRRSRRSPGCCLFFSKSLCNSLQKIMSLISLRASGSSFQVHVRWVQSPKIAFQSLRQALDLKRSMRPSRGTAPW